MGHDHLDRQFHFDTSFQVRDGRVVPVGYWAFCRNCDGHHYANDAPHVKLWVYAHTCSPKEGR